MTTLMYNSLLTCKIPTFFLCFAILKLYHLGFLLFAIAALKSLPTLNYIDILHFVLVTHPLIISSLQILTDRYWKLWLILCPIFKSNKEKQNDTTKVGTLSSRPIRLKYRRSDVKIENILMSKKSLTIS